jgi:hypothetical protein
MKVLTINFLTCAVKACKSSSNSYPLHPKDAELVQDEIELNADMVINVLPRLDWTALKTTTSEVSTIPTFLRSTKWRLHGTRFVNSPLCSLASQLYRISRPRQRS